MSTITVRDNRDVQFWTSVLRDNMIKSKERNDEIKRAVRKYLNRESACPDHVMVKDNGIDGFVERFPLPEYITSKDEGEEYFREFEYIRYRPTYYDCTGQLFTGWFKVFQKPDGRFWAYHSIWRDC